MRTGNGTPSRPPDQLHPMAIAEGCEGLESTRCCRGCAGKACMVHVGWGSGSENTQHERCKHKGVEREWPHTPACAGACTKARSHVPKCVFLTNDLNILDLGLGTLATNTR